MNVKPNWKCRIELIKRFILLLALTTIHLDAAATAGATEMAFAAKEKAQTDSFSYVDHTLGFSLRLPPGVKRRANDEPPHQMIFTGFPVPEGTNLSVKTLIIADGNYDMLESADPLPPLKVNGVVFKRMKLYDGHAGGMTLHIIYTWIRGGKENHFDFIHRSVNASNFNPQDRPIKYDENAQMKQAEQIMGSFRKLKKE